MLGGLLVLGGLLEPGLCGAGLLKLPGRGCAAWMRQLRKGHGAGLGLPVASAGGEQPGWGGRPQEVGTGRDGAGTSRCGERRG